MKQKHTQARKANTRYDKRTTSAVHTMTVIDRRRRGIFGADHREFSEKHGMLDATPGMPFGPIYPESGR